MAGCAWLLFQVARPHVVGPLLDLDVRIRCICEYTVYRLQSRETERARCVRLERAGKIHGGKNAREKHAHLLDDCEHVLLNKGLCLLRCLQAFEARGGHPLTDAGRRVFQEPLRAARASAAS